jgi:hypothetical protein
MALLVTIVEGWTDELGPFTLRKNGQPINLTDITVTLRLRPVQGTVYSDTVGDVRVEADQTTKPGQVYFKPDANDFSARKSPYSVRWQLVDASNNTRYIPNSKAPDTIEVVKP